MSITAISTIQPKKKSNPSFLLTGAAGATVGAASRYVVPAKEEIGDTFISSAKNRAANRSMLKFGGIGAAVALGANILYRAFAKQDKVDNKSTEYTKLGALVDAPDYACQILWYGE